MLDLDRLKAVLFDVGDTLYQNREFREAYRDSLYRLLRQKLELPNDEVVKLSDPHLNQILVRLSRHYRLGIVSNDQSRMIKRILEALGIAESTFEVIVGEELTEKRKPDPEPLKYALSKHNLNPPEAVYVADSYRKDLKPAQSIGMQTLLVGSGSDSVDAQVSTIYDLEEKLL